MSILKIMYTQEEAKQIRKKFWTLFGDRCKIVPELKGRKKKWILYDTKVKGLDLKFDVGRRSAKVMVELNDRSENKRLELFEKLEKYKAILESGFESGLEWELVYEYENGKQVCRIFTKLEGVDIHKQQQWPEIYNFFIENMIQLENNFLSIKDVIIEENE